MGSLGVYPNTIKATSNSIVKYMLSFQKLMTKQQQNKELQKHAPILREMRI